MKETTRLVSRSVSDERYDTTLLLVTVFLVMFGIIMVFSASSAISFKEAGNQYGYFTRHLIFAILGFVLMFTMMRIDYHLIRNFVYPLLLGSILLLVLVLIPGVGRSINGARRWIAFMGLSFQPAELAKLAMVVYLAYSLTKKDDMIKTLRVGFIPHMIVLTIIAFLIASQPDLGASITVGVIAFIMLFIAGTRISYILASILAAIPIIYYSIINVEYRLKRIMVYLDPWEDPLDSGYHIIQSFLALGSGGVFGTGLGEGTQKLFYLPYAYSDFIFAIIGEELGFVGALIIILAFVVFAVRGMRTARRAPDLFGTYLAVGITSLIIIGVIFNIGVVTGLFPTKGMTLPFISYGGSSLVTTMTAAGILLNVSSQGGGK